MQGSDWIRCDLHIHSPASFYHQYGDRNDPAVWEKFIKELESLPVELKVVGINDYLTVDGYERVLAAKKSGRLPNIKCILPVVEFRLNRLVGNEKTKRLNYHVIFSNEIDADTIRTQFISALSAAYQLEAGSKHPTWSGIISEDSLKQLGRLIKEQSPGNASLQAESDWDVGFNNFNVDYLRLKEILGFSSFRNRVLTAIGKVEWEQHKWDGGGAGDKRTLINEANVVFTAGASVEACNKSRASLRAQNVNHILLDCSDAHSFANPDNPNRIGNSYTWIKAEPTFDGLRQILFEPDDRIYFGDTTPDKRPPYQVIDRVKFVGGADIFGNQELRVSPYLNSIIGGKSTGKSLLAGLIVKSADLQEYKRRTLLMQSGSPTDPLAWLEQKLSSLNFEVVWRDGLVTTLKNSASSSRRVTYFPQHYLNSNINDRGVGNKELNTIIRSVLAQNGNYSSAFEAYRADLQILNETIAATATSFESAIRDRREKRMLVSEKGKSSDVALNLEKLQEKFAELKTNSDLTEAEIQRHNELSQSVETASTRKGVAQLSLDVLNAINAGSFAEIFSIEGLLPASAPDEVIKAISSAIAPLLESFKAAAMENLKPIKIKYAEELAKLEKEILAASEELQPIQKKIESSGPLSELASSIEAEKEKLAQILAFEHDLASLQAKIDILGERLTGYVEKRLALASKVMSVSTQVDGLGDSDLKIEIQPRVKSAHVRDQLRERVKYVSNPSIKAAAQLEEPNDEDFKAYSGVIATIVGQAKDEVIEFKGEHKLAGVLQELLGNAIYLNYNLKLGPDSFSIMSPGKRALALLRVIIELDSSEHPIVLDQPEDDLDNRSIYDGLAAYLKKKKLSRQIIVVTHNPNVVVGSDSEHVIVANQSGQETNRDNENYRFEYVVGGLERSFLNPTEKWILQKQGIREHVCEILDGGKEAFRRREQLYSM